MFIVIDSEVKEVEVTHTTKVPQLNESNVKEVTYSTQVPQNNKKITDDELNLEITQISDFFANQEEEQEESFKPASPIKKFMGNSPSSSTSRRIKRKKL